MAELDDLLSLSATGADHFRAVVPDGWQQGRGAFGGLVCALLIRAAEAKAADPQRPLRSLTAELIGPTRPGRVDIFVETLRTGTGVTTLAVRLVQAGEIQAHAVAVHARARDPELEWTELKPPVMPPWGSVALGAPELAPVFTQHCEFRPVHAPLFAGEDEARAEGWLRFKRPPTRRDAAYAAMLCDGYWPAAFSRLTAPRPAATLTFALQPLADLSPLDPELPVYHRARAPVSRAGYSVELRELWSATGELLALNQQTFAVIR